MLCCVRGQPQERRFGRVFGLVLQPAGFALRLAQKNTRGNDLPPEVSCRR